MNQFSFIVLGISFGWFAVSGGVRYFRAMSFDPAWLADKNPTWKLQSKYSPISILQTLSVIVAISLILIFPEKYQLTAILAPFLMGLLVSPLLKPPTLAENDAPKFILKIKNFAIGFVSKTIILAIIGVISWLIPFSLPSITGNGSTVVPLAFFLVIGFFLFGRSLNAILIAQDHSNEKLQPTYLEVSRSILPTGLGILMLIYLVGGLQIVQVSIIDESNWMSVSKGALLGFIISNLIDSGLIPKNT